VQDGVFSWLVKVCLHYMEDNGLPRCSAGQPTVRQQRRWRFIALAKVTGQ
jgi:hypothetical protein